MTIAEWREEGSGKTTIGRGRLTWNGRERRSDRYGAVKLMKDGNSLSASVEWAPLHIPEEWREKRVRLLARVLETRQSTHIGDLFRGVYPRTPIVGEVISLGEGILRLGRDPSDDTDTVELVPLDWRTHDWMLIRGLYDTHEQTVELIAEALADGDRTT